MPTIQWSHPNGLFGEQPEETMEQANQAAKQMIKDGCNVEIIEDKKTFTIYWRDGQKSVIKGDDVGKAFTEAGYNGSAIGAVDFYTEGENDDYVWNKEKRTWDKK